MSQNDKILDHLQKVVDQLLEAWTRTPCGR